MIWLLISAGVIAFGGVLLGYDRWKRREVTQRYPAEGERVKVDGVSVHVLVRGGGRPVVLLHGNYGDATDFSGRLRERVSRDFQAVIIDRPGYGHSERPPAGLSVSGQAELVRDAVQRVGIEQPLLVAHSWSGFLALAYALEHGSELAGPRAAEPALLRRRQHAPHRPARAPHGARERPAYARAAAAGGIPRVPRDDARAIRTRAGARHRGDGPAARVPPGAPRAAARARRGFLRELRQLAANSPRATARSRCRS